MKYTFTAQGHPNILSTHETTLEFTKDAHLTTKGDCIVAVGAAFELSRLKEFLDCRKVKIVIEAGNCKDVVTAVPNKKFSSSAEMVIRLGDFPSERTFATRADKSAAMLDRKLIHTLKNGAQAAITISEVNNI